MRLGGGLGGLPLRGAGLDGLDQQDLDHAGPVPTLGSGYLVDLGDDLFLEPKAYLHLHAPILTRLAMADNKLPR